MRGPKLCLITPADKECLTLTEHLPGRFCIASQLKNSIEYWNYFHAAAKKGYEVILDNGVFENDIIEDQELIDFACNMNVSILVCPDIIGGDIEENWERTLDFIERAKRTQYPGRFMHVPQCPPDKHLELMDFLDMFTYDSRNVPEELTHLGICRDALANAFRQWTHTEDQELNRLFFGYTLESDGLLEPLIERFKFHFLGLGDNLWALQYYWYVDSVDTASLFWQGYQGMSVSTNGVLATLTKRPKDYFTRKYQLSEDEKYQITRNCYYAQKYSDMAGELKRKLRGGKL
jgi:hypothetical protein